MQNAVRANWRPIGLMSILSLLVWSAVTPSDAMGTIPADVPNVVVETRCPPMRHYNATDVRKAGAELRKLLDADPKSVTPAMIADYKLLRDQCRFFSKK